MFKLIIVDDEKIVRNGLKNTVKWNEYGFTVVGTAQNGIEALELIEKKSPDAVLTDNKMPEMDGISLAREIKNKFPMIKVVILSAYDDFKYAQEAIYYNVKAYLLKPSKENEIKQVFEALHKEILEERLHKDEDHYEKHNILRDLLTGFNINHNSKQKIVSAGYIKEEYIRMAILSFNLSSHKAQSINLNKILFDGADKYPEFAKFPKLTHMNQLVLFISSKKTISKDEIRKILSDFKLHIEDIIKEDYSIDADLIIGIGSNYKGLDMIHKSYSEALYAYNYKYYKHDNAIIFFQDLNENSLTLIDEYDLTAAMDDLIDNILTNNRNATIIDIHRFFGLIEKYRALTIEETQLKCIEVIFALDLKLREKSADTSFYDKKALVNKIKSIEFFEELKYWFEDDLLQILDDLHNSNVENTSFIVKKAKEYVAKNINERITLDDIAKLCYTNSSYFSYSFKKITGENFSDYVSRKKVEKAKDLLIFSDKKINEIAEMVGINNYSYFCKVFKKIEGMTPIKYRINITRQK